MRTCSKCGMQGHNVKTCKMEDFEEGQIVLKSFLKKKFKDIEHKRWNSGKWESVPAISKFTDNKYEVMNIEERDLIKIVYLKSNSQLVKFYDMKNSSMNRLTFKAE